MNWTAQDWIRWTNIVNLRWTSLDWGYWTMVKWTLQDGSCWITMDGAEPPWIRDVEQQLLKLKAIGQRSWRTLGEAERQWIVVVERYLVMLSNVRLLKVSEHNGKFLFQLVYIFSWIRSSTQQTKEVFLSDKMSHKRILW